MKTKYKCIVEIECTPELPEESPEQLAQTLWAYKKRIDEGIEKEMEEIVRDSVVSEHDYVHIERVYLTFE